MAITPIITWPSHSLSHGHHTHYHMAITPILRTYYTHARTYARAHTHTHAHTSTHKHMHTHTFAHAHTRTRTHAHTHTHAHSFPPFQVTIISAHSTTASLTKICTSLFWPWKNRGNRTETNPHPAVTSTNDCIMKFMSAYVCAY